MTDIPTLYRAVKGETVFKSHRSGKLWFRSLKYFRTMEGPGRDPMEGVGSYTVRGMLHRDVSDENAIFPPFALSFSELPLREYGDFVLKLERPNALRERVLCKFPERTRVQWYRIEYGKKAELDTVPGPTEVWKRKHFTKPERFAHEKEWRLVMFLPPPLRLLNDTLKPHVGRLQGLFELMPQEPSGGGVSSRV